MAAAALLGQKRSDVILEIEDGAACTVGDGGLEGEVGGGEFHAVVVRIVAAEAAFGFARRHHGPKGHSDDGLAVGIEGLKKDGPVGGYLRGKGAIGL